MKENGDRLFENNRFEKNSLKRHQHQPGIAARLYRTSNPRQVMSMFNDNPKRNI
jgi:hypothetical protein